MVCVDLGDMLNRCRALETRSAALYRRFAVGAHALPDLCALWNTMADDEEEHARILGELVAHLPTIDIWTTRIPTRWSEVASEIDVKLCEAELLAGGTGTDQQLAAALELEMTEFEPLQQMLVAVSQRRPPRPIAETRALRLADAAERFSSDPQVRLRAARLRGYAHAVGRGAPA